MGQLTVHVTSDDIAGDYENLKNYDSREAVAYLQNVLQRLACGASAGDVEIESGTALAKAAGTLTFDTVIATDVVTINGVDFTCVASGASGNQFDKGGDDSASAAAAAVAINASATALVSEHVTATSAAAVLTITAKEFGDEGDAVTIASVDSTITASGARLTGGEDADVVSHSFG